MKIILLITVILSLACTSQPKAADTETQRSERAQQTLDSLFCHYSVPQSFLLRETFPFDSRYTATYLATEEQNNQPNPYAYLWPYSGVFSAVNALMEAGDSDRYRRLLDERVLPGLEEYLDENRHPAAYASYIRTAPISDRFYDDNVWLGIDFTDIYAMTHSEPYLEKAKLIWDFILSGTDNKLDGGIYWCEQKKESKNTCSNAPGAVYGLKLFQATGDSAYFRQGKAWYEWTKHKLQDTTDHLYFDNIRLDGKIGRAKFAYNSGQMMQAASLLYKITGDSDYLTQAQALAEACYGYFFHDFTGKDGKTFRLINRGDVWFTAVMLRGFIELYHLDKNSAYIDAFAQNLDYAWQHSRDERGLFHVDFSGEKKERKKWLLTQAAMVEMYARMAALGNSK